MPSLAPSSDSIRVTDLSTHLKKKNLMGLQVVQDLRTMVDGCTCGGATPRPKGGRKNEKVEEGEDVEMEEGEEDEDRMVPLTPKYE